MTDVDETSEQETDVDLDDLRNPYLEDEIPRLIDTSELDDNGNSTDVWTKIYLNGNIYAKDSNGTISINVGDMFVDKDH